MRITSSEDAKRVQSYRLVKIPEHAHPICRMLFAEMRRQKLSIRKLAEISGVSRHTIEAWMNAKTPQLVNIIAALNSIGLDLTVTEVGSGAAECMTARMPTNGIGNLTLPETKASGSERKSMSQS